MTHGKRILLVEDNELNRDMMVRRLNRAGLEVITAGNGQQASRYHALRATEYRLNGYEPARPRWLGRQPQGKRRCRASETFPLLPSPRTPPRPTGFTLWKRAAMTTPPSQ